MKNNVALKSLIGLILLLNIVACNKKSIDNQELNLLQKGSGPMAESRSLSISCLEEYGPISIENDMLVFTDYEQLEGIRACLQEQVDMHNAWFDSQYGHLPPSEQQDIIEETGFDEFQPLTDFEAALGFKSLRQTINAAVTIWLQQDLLDFDNNPDNHPVQVDELRALLNPDAKVKIGETVYDFDEDGVYHHVEPGDCRRTLTEKDTTPPLMIPGVRSPVVFEVRAAISYFVVSSVVSTRVRAFELLGPGRTRPLRINMWANIADVVRGNFCDGQFIIPNQLVARNRSSLTTSFSTSTFNSKNVTFPMATVVASCELRGFGAINNPNTNLVVCL